MKLKTFIVAVMLGLSPGLVLAEGSAVGNGGDVVSRFLETTRYTLKEALRRVLVVPANQPSLCESQNNLTADQKLECRDFIVKVARQIIELNSRPEPTRFLLRDEPLWVKGPDGVARQVDARTQLGSEGEIEFFYPQIRNFAPAQLLTLITHEFGHKVSYEGRFVEDNAPTRAFSSGRALLDAAGFALTTFAEDQAIVGRYFRLFDSFSCTVTGVGGSWGTQGASPRLFTERGDFDRFEAGIGIRPNDLVVWALEAPGIRLHFRAELREAHGCRIAETDGRGVKLAIVRENTRHHSEEEVASQAIDGWNPVCESDPRPLKLEFGGYVFECAYAGSFGRSD